MTATADATQADPDLRWYEQPASAHPAATVLAVALLVSGPILVFSMASSRWFYLDEWDFLVTRRATSPADLLRPHNENWSTIPILIWRAIFNLVHLNAYWPYVIPVVLAHLAVVALLWLVMRRSGVNQWVALLVAGLLLWFGSGYENIVWGFQIGFTGALAFGLVQLLAADHDGPLDRRDWWGLAAGLAALLCSGVAVTTVIVVGLAALMRRGWRAAAFHTVPLGLLYLVWAALAHPGTPGNPTHAGPPQVAHAVWNWDVASARYAFVDLGHYPVVAVLLAVLTVGGLALAWVPMGRDLLRRQSLVIACLGGALVFATITAVGRWEFGTAYSSSSRYVYLVVAFVLPAVAVAASAVIRRWLWSAPLVVAVLVIGVPGNVQQFGRQSPPAGYVGGAQQFVASLASSPEVTQVPPGDLVGPGGYPDLTTGWLAQAQRHGWLPAVKVRIGAAAQATVILGLAQDAKSKVPASARCRTITGPTVLQLPAGAGFWVKALPGLIGYPQLPDFNAVIVDVGGHPTSLSAGFQGEYGSHFTVALPGLRLRVTPALLSPVPVKICR